MSNVTPVKELLQALEKDPSERKEEVVRNLQEAFHQLGIKENGLLGNLQNARDREGGPTRREQWRS